MSCTMRGMTVCVHLSLECDRPRKSEIGLANPLRDATSNKICKEAVVGKAVWNNAVLAESETYETVDGNIYFTMDALNREYLNESETTTDYSWKGAANYLSVMVDDYKVVCSGDQYTAHGTAAAVIICVLIVGVPVATSVRFAKALLLAHFTNAQ